MRPSTTVHCTPKTRIKVVHLIPGNLYGGVETFLVALARHRHLSPKMQHTFVLCYRRRLSDELTGEGADVRFVPPARLSRPWSVWNARRSLTVRLRECQAEVVVSHHVWPLAVFGPTLHKARLPVCVYLHGPMGGNGRLERWAAGYLPAQLIAVSQHTLKTFRPFFPTTPAEVIHYPMPWPEHAFGMTTENRKMLRQSLNTSADAVVILQASRIETWKGQDILLNALERLRDIPHWVFWMAGGSQRPHEKRYLGAIRRQAAQLGLSERIRFLGERRDVRRLMGAADIYCQGNRGPEGFSLAFLEAFSAGLPIVTSAIGGAPEIIDQSCGRLVPPEDPEALSQALRELSTNPVACDQLGAAATRRAREVSDPARQLNRLRSVVTALRDMPKALCA